tara:strand:+ start:13690 stop:14961 length:1272 start_codon:yes stop_codon:yes gene_type:complete
MQKEKIAIIGLGYVGLPLAIEFGKKIDTIGFDIKSSRIDELQSGYDSTFEVNQNEFNKNKNLKFTSNPKDIRECNIFIITVPTPINHNKEPDLTSLINSSETVGKILKEGDIVIYESTVFPGATEEVCVPVLEKFSNLKFNENFFCGYSPERINPGDKNHRLTNIKKITSGSTSKTAKAVDKLYNKIIKAGTYKASSIKVAEAAKVIENIQRDINISLINELAIIFNKLEIDTESILEAAGTKWNFLPFRPGLVGGHCISVDPYYLAHKSNQVGYDPKVLLSGRRLNDSMPSYIVSEVFRLMKDKNIKKENSNILIMGISFKEDCPDIRNSKIFDMILELNQNKCNVDVFDPVVNSKTFDQDVNFTFYQNNPPRRKYDAIIIAVSHSEFKKLSIEKIRSFTKNKNIIYDVKYLLKQDQVDGRL